MDENRRVRPSSRSRRASRTTLRATVPDDEPIDLRSDTVTAPTAAMRKAMAAAEVADDVLDRDPTMRELEERVAGMLGAADALWTPTGSMANLIALMSHLGRGESFLAPQGAHVLDSELGTAAWLAGGMPRPLPHDGGPGKVTASAVRRAAADDGSYTALHPALLCLENTHNAAGGTITAPEEHAAVAAAARAARLAVHLDGARLWNAAVALGVPPGALTVGADTVSVSLSKGLGAPVGSVVAGSVEFVEQARRLRKMLGGGIRQGGILAAAGLVALEDTDRLTEDHALATKLAAGMRERGWRVREPQTNIVLVDVADLRGTIGAFGEAGVKAGAVGGKLRLMTHRDVTEKHVTAALDRIGEVGPASTGSPGAPPAPFPRRDEGAGSALG
ncbi:low specificity L-threonine aldolase [Pseudonocardia sp. C8]|uniref:threonine aldolase family protein n=1 Tax=Pseudonocardia sp. C8 TaxID=2762759 RepID=UPI001642E38B|nr:threonine aldolase family protein [Pseudonocardia sp. C8]MBC3194116.1 low specificity L-threonine aldolase [Pseudonocardia sp. C8]